MIGDFAALQQLGARHQPTLVAYDRPGQRVADLNVKIEPAAFHELVRIADRSPAPWQNQAKKGPPPNDKPHATIVQHERETKPERSERLDEQALEAAMPLVLGARKAAIGELPA